MAGRVRYLGRVGEFGGGPAQDGDGIRYANGEWTRGRLPLTGQQAHALLYPGEEIVSAPRWAVAASSRQLVAGNWFLWLAIAQHAFTLRALSTFLTTAGVDGGHGLHLYRGATDLTRIATFADLAAEFSAPGHVHVTLPGDGVDIAAGDRLGLLFYPSGNPSVYAAVAATAATSQAINPFPGVVSVAATKAAAAPPGDTITDPSSAGQNWVIEPQIGFWAGGSS